jgi:hypothetical protein
MPRISQAPAVKGSQKWIQRLANERPDLMNSLIRTQLNLSDTDKIKWLSSVAEDGYAEYRDQAFLDLLDITLPKTSLPDFWPSRGPVWDGLGRSESGKVFLVEAKSHISEVLSPKTGAGVKSLRKIKKSLDDTKTFLHSNSEHDWASTFYQYTNRLAHLYLLRALNEVPAYKVPYTMRHSFAAWALSLRMDPNRLVNLMGHGSKKMIYEVYGHYVEGLEKDAGKILGYFGKDFIDLQEKNTLPFAMNFGESLAKVAR